MPRASRYSRIIRRLHSPRILQAFPLASWDRATDNGVNQNGNSRRRCRGGSRPTSDNGREYRCRRRTRGCTDRSGCPDVEGERTDRCVHRLPPGSSSLYRQADRASPKLRRPSRHRHRERSYCSTSCAQRTTDLNMRTTATSPMSLGNGDVEGQGHQSFSVRSEKPVFGNCGREFCQALRSRPDFHFPFRWRDAASSRGPTSFNVSRSKCIGSLIDTINSPPGRAISVAGRVALERQDDQRIFADVSIDPEHLRTV